MTARHGAQLFADVNVTLHVALERNVVESAAPVPVEPGMNKKYFRTTEAFGANSELASGATRRPDAGTITP